MTYERLLNPEPSNWLSNNMTYNSNRYSTLDEINTDTVKGLKLAFAVPLAPASQGSSFASSALQGTPLVEDGIMWTTDGWGRVYRIDESEIMYFGPRTPAAVRHLSALIHDRAR